MPIPTRPNPNPYHYHVYDIPCGHGGGAVHGGGGACGPHVVRPHFPSAHVDSWLPPVPVPLVAAPPVHQARADAATRTREEAPLRGGGGALPADINVHPVAAGDQTGNNRLSLLRDMEDLQTVARAVPSLYAVPGSIGTTHFGREIRYIMFGGNNGLNAPQVLLTGGVHAREWIAVEVPYLIAEYLIKNYDPPGVTRNGRTARHQRISQLIDACQICVIPMLNPDGHCWSMAVGNRQWRKNRRRWTKTQLTTDYSQVYTKAALSRKLQYKNDRNRWVTPERRTDPFQDKIDGQRVYFGVDCNRNCWQAGVGGAANPQPDPTVETYAGPVPFTEGETFGLNTFLGGNLTRLAASIDYHSAMGRVLYHEDAANAAGPITDARERNAITHVAGCMQGHIAQYSVDAGPGTCHDAYPQATTISVESQGRDRSVGSIMDLCHRKMISDSRIPLAYTIELDPIKRAPAAGGGYNPACNAGNRWFRISPARIQAVFEKNLTAVLCLMEYAILNPQTVVAATRGANGTTIAGQACPFRPAVGGGGGGNDMVAHIFGRGNQPPT